MAEADKPQTDSLHHLVPWKFKNVHASNLKHRERTFYFGSYEVVVAAPDVGSIAIDLTANTGRRFWDAAYLLSRFIHTSLHPASHVRRPKAAMLRHPFAGATVLELGSGTSGLLPLVALACGAQCVVGTDCDAEVLVRLDAGVRANLSRWREADAWKRDADAVWTVEDLRWGDVGSQERVLARVGSLTGSDAPVRNFDVIVASEILYLASEHKALAKTIRAFCGPHTRVWMSYKKRGLGEEGFARMAKWAGLDFAEVPRELYDPEFVTDLDHVIIELKLSQE